MTFRVMSTRTMDTCGASGPAFGHGGSDVPYACDPDEGSHSCPNWGRNAAGTEGSSTGTRTTDRRLFRTRRRIRPLGNESRRCTSTSQRQTLWFWLVCRSRGGWSPEQAKRARGCPMLRKQQAGFVGIRRSVMGEPASKDDPRLENAVDRYDRRPSVKPSGAAIVELRVPARSQNAIDRSAGAAVAKSGGSPRAGRRPSTEAEHWVEHQLESAPTMTEDRWRQITNLVYRQTMSTRSGEKRPPLTAAGLITAAASTDSMTARR